MISFARRRWALAGFAVAATPAVAAAAPTEPGGLTNPIEPSSECNFCHAYQNAQRHVDAPLYAPFIGWRGTLMANAARDPVFWAGVAIADQDEPGGTEDCIRCHSPQAFLAGRGLATSIDELEPVDIDDGVGCDLCHRMVDDGVTPAGNARYGLDDVLTPEGVVARRGIWDYTDGVPPAEHPTVADPFIADSAFCGTCHDVTTTTPRVDDRGQPLGGGFNEQRTYSEWATSEFAEAGETFRSCQDCHMPPVADMAGCKNFVDIHAHPTGGRRHDLAGANRFMLDVLQQMYGSAGTDEVSDIYFDIAKDRTDEFLSTAATLAVAAPELVDLEQGLAALTVTVTNESGHKLPTGYSEGRIMWLEVVASYGDTVVWSSGAWDQSRGIEQDGQLRSYAAVAESSDDGAVFHLLRNDHWLFDTRIPPRGLRPSIETDPIGGRYVLGEDGTWPNFDRHEYAFEARTDIVDLTPDEPDDDVLSVAIRLRLLINTPEYIEFLAAENVTNAAGADVADLFVSLGGAVPTTLAEQTLEIPLRGLVDPARGSSSGDEDTSGGTTASSTSSSSTSGAATDASETEPAADASASGCGCRQAAPGRHTGVLWIALLGFARARRARRRLPGRA